MPTLGDYEDFNINLAGEDVIDQGDEGNQVYDFKDVLHSIRDQLVQEIFF